ALDATSQNNLISDGTGMTGLTNGTNGNQVGGGANPVIDPLLTPLGNYGGPTQTMALLPGSPAIAGGVNTTLATPTGITFTTGSGSLAAGTYYYRVTAYNSTGETLASA